MLEYIFFIIIILIFSAKRGIVDIARYENNAKSNNINRQQSNNLNENSNGTVRVNDINNF